jgi:hypothetical protein
MNENLKRTPGDEYDPGQDEETFPYCTDENCHTPLYDEDVINGLDHKPYCGECIGQVFNDTLEHDKYTVECLGKKQGGFLFLVKEKPAAKRGNPGELNKAFLLSLHWEKVNQLPFDDGEQQELWEIEAKLGAAIIRRIGTYSLGELIDVEAE